MTRLGHQDLTVVTYENLDVGQVVAMLEDRLAIRARKGADTLATNLLRDERTLDFAGRFLADYKASYRAREKKTHVALQVTVDPVSLKIGRNVAPDAVTLD
ncbi:hypothetical protein VK792_15490 [Mesobacterium sp. TK19101]|uniref:Uncharacterized protein n=1 Tax=Mesobacterium hydrothermale TaxID=3111907 RepID=A0ABU6HJS5_9RHOB|nr:hypothetical protein [Mesobacterium sp. TK19101]MEC3862694.1 hypothetical protein [Mesobacterium sp. TK19101]